MANHAVVIGGLGCKRVYINITRDEALERFNKDEFYGPYDRAWMDIHEFDFEDEFGAYDVYGG